MPLTTVRVSTPVPLVRSAVKVNVPVAIAPVKTSRSICPDVAVHVVPDSLRRPDVTSAPMV